MEPLDLSRDVDELCAVCSVEAPTAKVFCAARLLEAVVVQACRTLPGASPTRVFGALVRLGRLGLLSERQTAAFHALRRLGNAARHCTRSIGTADADLAVAILHSVLAWGAPYACADARTVPASDELCQSIHDLADEGVVPADVDLKVIFSHAPLAGLYAELLMVRGELDQVREVAAYHPQDLRLRQLDAWARRQEGDIQGALATFEELYKVYSEDPECAGFLAGTLKRLWSDGRRWRQPAARRRTLVRAAKIYRRAWKLSQGCDGYTGVNAASTHALLGDWGVARSVAEEVLGLYASRRSIGPELGEVHFCSMWDRATYAEALLVAGRFEAARREYVAVEVSQRAKRTALSSTRGQLSLLLDALQMGTPDEFLRMERPMTKPTYSPAPLASFEDLPGDLAVLVERLAAHNHDVWAAGRIADGWRYGPERDDVRLLHPGLVPYDELSESEKDYDRRSVQSTLAGLLTLGYEVKSG